MSKSDYATMATLRKGQYPAPVYEAHLSNGEIVRMTFWTIKGKPHDVARGRRHGERAAERRGYGVTLIDGFVDQASAVPVRYRDPSFDPAAENVKPIKPRITAKAAREALGELLAWLDGDHEDESVLNRARALAA